MRVNQSGNNYVQNNEASGSKQTSRASAPNATKRFEKVASATAGGTEGAKPEISAKAKEFARAKEVASNAPDIREEKIAELRRRIAAGQYKTDPEEIADRMVDHHLEMADIL